MAECCAKRLFYFCTKGKDEVDPELTEKNREIERLRAALRVQAKEQV